MKKMMALLLGAGFAASLTSKVAQAADANWAKDGVDFVEKLNTGIAPIVSSIAGVAILGIVGFMLFTQRLDFGWIARLGIAGALLSFGYPAWSSLVD